MALAILRPLNLSGVLKSEITSLKWSEVDVERSCLRLGDSKTGAKVILLGPTALAEIAQQERHHEADRQS